MDHLVDAEVFSKCLVSWS